MKNSIKYRLLAIILVVSGLFAAWSCKKAELDLTDVNTGFTLNPEIATPLVYGSLSMEDFLNMFPNEDSIIRKYDDSLIYVVYSDTLFSISVQDEGTIEDIPDQHFIQEYIESDVTLNQQWIDSNVGDTVYFNKVKEEEWTFDNNERLDSIHLKSLMLVIDVHSTFKHTGLLDMNSENFTIDGTEFDHQVLISDVSGNFTHSDTIYLDDHWMYLDNSTPGVTKIALNYDLRLINSGNPVLAGEFCEITMTFSGLEFYSIFGYVGDYSFPQTPEIDTLEFGDLGSMDLGGDLYFENPQFNLTINNSFGVPIGFDLSGMSAYSSSKDQSLNFTLDENPYKILAYGLDSVGYYKQTQISINNSNSNISDIISLLPSRITYMVDGQTNPDGLVTDNYVTDSSGVFVEFEAVIPLYLRAYGFTLEDTSEFNFSKDIGADADLVDSLAFVMDISNGLPFDVRLQVFFVDSTWAVLDSMFEDDAFLQAPLLNEQDKVETPRDYTKVASINAEKIDRIQDTKNLLIRATVSTSEAGDGKSVKFYSYYDLSFKLKAFAKLIIEETNDSPN